MARRNDEVALLLENIAKMLEVRGETPYRIRAYWEAAQHIRAAPEDIDALAATGHLRDIPGVGSSIAEKIDDYLRTGRSSYYEDLKNQTEVQATDLLDVPSIGPGRASLLYQHLGITSVDELIEAADDGRLLSVPGIGSKLRDRLAEEAIRVRGLARQGGRARVA
jgi:DNA polymerase (family X)